MHGPVTQAIRSLEDLSATVVLHLPPLPRARHRRVPAPPLGSQTHARGDRTGARGLWRKPAKPGDLVEAGELATLGDHTSLERWLGDQIDRIPELDREGLLIASVIGTEFDAALLAQVMNGNGDETRPKPSMACCAISGRDVWSASSRTARAMPSRIRCCARRCMPAARTRAACMRAWLARWLRVVPLGPPPMLLHRGSFPSSRESAPCEEDARSRRCSGRDRVSTFTSTMPRSSTCIAC